MPVVVINRSGQHLPIPEIRKILPFDGREYTVPYQIFIKYRSYLERVPVELEAKVKEQDSIINEQKKNCILVDVMRLCKPKVKSKPFDFLYSFHFDKDIEQAIERLKISINSIKDQNVRICVCNTSPECIKPYLNEYDINYIHIPHKLETYCKSKTINLGVKNLVKSEYFFTSDIDLVYPPTFIDYMTLFTFVHNPLRVVFSNYNIGEVDSNPKTYEECKKVYILNKDNRRAPKFYAPGNGLVHLPTFKKIGGYDERFVGHGSEDSEFNYRMSKLNKYFTIDLDEVNTYHLWHPYTTNIEKNIKVNEQMWRYIVWKGETDNIDFIKAGELEFPDDLMEKEWSLQKDFV